ncbi:hypothetical protein [Aliarcobacter butzleri]|uniref:hypothetical protein n=1 Tax=Aliarcobacter butzleri TaxID=28197 RepID=UPI00215AB1A9|nr:hypothetical protein [Aliarcobacter butzleri]MCR8709846.1 hypothetical protein [Aliarcobacter butzleri]
MKRYIAIDLLALKKHQLTLEEWTLLENIYFMSNNEFGWCYASKDTLRDIIQVSNGQIYKIIKKLLDNGFLVKNNETGYLKVTQKWITISSGIVDTKGCGDPLQKMENISPKNGIDPLQKMETKIDNTKRDIKKEERESNSNPTNTNFEEEKNIPHSFSKDEELNPKLVIEAYREKISNKYGDIQEQGSFTQISLRKNDISKMLIGIDNLAIGLKLTGKKPPKLKFWISEREYLDYQNEQVIELGKNEALVPSDLIGKSFTVDGETIKFLKDGYLKIEKDWKITNAKNVADMVNTIRTALGGLR